MSKSECKWRHKLKRNKIKLKKKWPKNMEQTKCLPLSVIGYTIVVLFFLLTCWTLSPDYELKQINWKCGIQIFLKNESNIYTMISQVAELLYRSSFWAEINVGRTLGKLTITGNRKSEVNNDIIFWIKELWQNLSWFW